MEIQEKYDTDSKRKKLLPGYTIGGFYVGTTTSHIELHGDDIPIMYSSAPVGETYSRHTYSHRSWGHVNHVMMNFNDNYGSSVHVDSMSTRTLGSHNYPNYGTQARLSSYALHWQGGGDAKIVLFDHPSNYSASDSTAGNPKYWVQQDFFNTKDTYNISLYKITESGNTFPTQNNVQWTENVYQTGSTMRGSAVDAVQNWTYRTNPVHQINDENPNSQSTLASYVAGKPGWKYWRYYYNLPEDFLYYQPSMPDYAWDGWFNNAWMVDIVAQFKSRGTSNHVSFKFLIKDNQSYIPTSGWSGSRYDNIYESSTKSPLKVSLELYDETKHKSTLANSWLLSSNGKSLTFYVDEVPQRNSAWANTYGWQTKATRYTTRHRTVDKYYGMGFLAGAIMGDKTYTNHLYYNNDIYARLRNLAAFNHVGIDTDAGQPVVDQSLSDKTKYNFPADSTRNQKMRSLSGGLWELMPPTSWSYNSKIKSHIAPVPDDWTAY